MQKTLYELFDALSASEKQQFIEARLAWASHTGLLGEVLIRMSKPIEENS